MKLKHLGTILIVFMALLLTAMLHQIIPERTFDSYVLELDSVWNKENTQQEYWVDINADDTTEKIIHHNINISGHSIELHANNKLNEIYIFRDNESFIGQYFFFADLNRNTNKELLFVSVKNNIAYLNIMAYRAHTRLLYPVEKIVLDTVSLRDGKTDVVNNYIIANGANIYLDLQAAYTVQPRNIYNYNFESKKLTKTKLNSLVAPGAVCLNYHQQNYILATNVKAAGNTISHNEANSLKNSTNKDTLEMYESVKHLEYDFGDFSSYILLYNQQLRFAFKPIEFFGWTNYTKTAWLMVDSVPYIAALTNAQKEEPENLRSKSIMVCDLKGKVIAQKKLPHEFTDIYSYTDKIYFFGDKSLYLYSNTLDELKNVSGFSFAYGFANITPNAQPEFIAFDNNVLTVLNADLEVKTKFKIEQEFTPYPQENGISVFYKNGKTSLKFNTRLYYYVFNYSSNKYAALEYPFYMLVFVGWLALLIAIIKINSQRLEKEKLKLEQIVMERTSELKDKNSLLDRQKSEIQLQAEVLKNQNKHLEDLDKFKQTLIGTLVHDLKNPLGQILNISENKTVNGLSRKILMRVSNLLDIDKYEQTALKLSKEMHELNSIISEAADNLAISLREKNLTLQVNAHNVAVWADKDILVRVFENLLSNAIRFSPLNQAIEIHTQLLPDNTVQVSINNFGEYIPDASLQQIFDKYMQAQVINTSGYKSTGLGLTFCKMALEAHGHTIKAENIDGGVSFTFYLDAALQTTVQNNNTEAANEIMKLTDDEKMILKPWFEKLNALEIFQMSEIFEILHKIPEATDNISVLKKQIADATYASNKQLFTQLTDI